jgi:hypothetical protein
MNVYQIIYTIVVHVGICSLLILWQNKAASNESDMACATRAFITCVTLLTGLYFGIWALVAIGKML